MSEDPAQRFASAAQLYGRYRTGYPAARVAEVAALTGVDRSSVVLDVGCGSGQFTVPLADRAGHVVAIDPVPDMLAAGRAAAGERTNIEWVLGDSSSLGSLGAPGARLAVFAASFHWTERDEVLRVLDRLLEPDGSVVVVNDVLGDDGDPDWARAVGAVRKRFLGSAQRVETDRRREGHRAVLERSPFSSVSRTVWEWERELSVDEAVGLQFTYSFSTPALRRPCRRVRGGRPGGDPRAASVGSGRRTVPSRGADRPSLTHSSQWFGGRRDPSTPVDLDAVVQV